MTLPPFTTYTTTTYKTSAGRRGYHWRRYLAAKREDFYGRLDAREELAELKEFIRQRNEEDQRWIDEMKRRDRKFDFIMKVWLAIMVILFILMLVSGSRDAGE